MEKKITKAEFNKIVAKYQNDKIFFEELDKNEKEVRSDIEKACKFDLDKFDDIFPWWSLLLYANVIIMPS